MAVTPVNQFHDFPNKAFDFWKEGLNLLRQDINRTNSSLE